MAPRVWRERPSRSPGAREWFSTSGL